jgi:hypothetical protein
MRADFPTEGAVRSVTGARASVCSRRSMFPCRGPTWKRNQSPSYTLAVRSHVSPACGMRLRYACTVKRSPDSRLGQSVIESASLGSVDSELDTASTDLSTTHYSARNAIIGSTRAA